MENSLELRAKEYLMECDALEVTDKDSYDVAGVIITVGKDLEKRIKEFFGPMKKKAHEAWKTICATEKEHLDPVVKESGVLKRKQSDWRVEQERIAKKREDELKAKAEEQGLEPEMVHVPIPKIINRPGQREHWRYRLTGEALTPEEIVHLFHAGYLIYNDAKIRKEVAEKKEKTSIAGVKAYKDYT